MVELSRTRKARRGRRVEAQENNVEFSLNGRWLVRKHSQPNKLKKCASARTRRPSKDSKAPPCRNLRRHTFPLVKLKSVDYDNPYPLVHSSSNTHSELTKRGKIEQNPIKVTVTVHRNPAEQDHILVSEDGTDYHGTLCTNESLSKYRLPTKPSRSIKTRLGKAEADGLVLFNCHKNEVSQEAPSLAEREVHSFSNNVSEEEDLENLFLRVSESNSLDRNSTKQNEEKQQEATRLVPQTLVAGGTPSKAITDPDRKET